MYGANFSSFLAQEVLPVMESDVKSWEQKYNACANLDKLQQKIDRLKQEMAWAFVCEKEKISEALAKELKEEEVGRLQVFLLFSKLKLTNCLT